MAHNFTSGVFVEGLSVSSVTREEAFWHGLGSKAPAGLPVRRYFELGGALYGVSSQEIMLASTNAKIDGYKAIVNLDTNEVLSIQTGQYHIVSNERLVELAEALREEVELISVAVMGGGKRAAFSARIRGMQREIKGREHLEMKLSGVNSFDGSQAFTVLFDPTRIECDNTVGWAINKADQRGSILRIAHRSNANELIKQVPNIINIAEHKFDKTIEEVEAMISAPCDTTLFQRMLEITFADELRKPVNDVRGDKSTQRPRRLTDIKGYDEMCNNFAGDLIGATELTNGTIWGAFNSITQFYRHQFAKGGTNSEARRYGSLMFGINQQRIQRAREAALELTRA